MLASQFRMVDPSRLARDVLRRAPLQAAVLLLFLFVALALTWHLVGMADHSDGMMGACVALLVVAGLILLLGEPLVLPFRLPS
jgi:hypothetical protein